MPVPTRIVTAHFEQPDSTPYANAQFSYRQIPWSYSPGAVVLGGSIPDTTDGAGDAQTLLWTNSQGMRPSRYVCMYPNGEQSPTFVLPSGDTPISLDELLALTINWGIPDIEDLLDARDASIYGAFANETNIELGDALVGAKLTNDGIERTVHDVLDFFDDELERHDAQFAVSSDVTVMNLASIIGATTIRVTAPPAAARVGHWALIDAYTVDCEARKIVSIAGNVITLNAALNKAHGIGDAVLWQPTPQFHLSYWGCKSDGVTDDSAGFIACLAAVHEYSGTMLVPIGTTRIDSKINVPNYDVAGPQPKRPRQNTIRITGQGGFYDGSSQAPRNASILDLRYAGLQVDINEDYKIDTRGVGLLEIDHVVLTDLGTPAQGTSTDPIPMIRTTNTTLQIHDCGFLGTGNRSGQTCDQDCIQLGGRSSDRVYDGSNDAPFQGYGTVIHHNYFNRIRRAIHCYDDVNGCEFSSNSVWAASGSNLGAGAAAFDFEGWGLPNTSNKLIGNTFEMVGYTYGIALRKAQNFFIAGNDFYDMEPPSNGGPTLGGILISGTSGHHFIIQGWSEDADAPYIDNQSSVDDNTVLTSHSGQPSDFGGAIRFKSNATLLGTGRFNIQSTASNTIDWQPAAAQAVGFALMRIRRSALEGTDPNTLIWNLAYGGKLTIGGANAGSIDVFDAAGVKKMTITSNMKSFVGDGTGSFTFDTAGGGGNIALKSANTTFYAAAGDQYMQVVASTGRIQWCAPPATVYDTNLYRSNTNELRTDDRFIANDGIQTKYLASAGRISCTDADFTATPADGSMAILRNTSDSTVRLALRANGIWFYTLVEGTAERVRAPDGLVTKYLSGAGLVTITDGDFTTAPPDGTVAVVRNSTDSSVRLAIRANGAWKVATFA